MPGGSLEPDDHAREQQCTHCGLWFALTGIHNHRRNCLLKDVDAMVQPVEESASDTRPSVEETAEDDRARADGGQPMDPPEPASDPTQEHPDHYADIDEWIEQVERRNPRLADTDDWARICAAAENHDYVDLEQTDLTAGEVELV